MSQIELLNKKIIENLKHVNVTNAELSSYVNGGGRPPNHGHIDWKQVEEMREEKNKDKNRDTKAD